MATFVSNVGNLVSEMLNPVGTVIQGPITSAPTGYLLCDGQDVSRTRYARLFDVIGINFGSGDGSTTFNVPDYRGCFLRMLSTNTAQNTNMYAKQESGLPNITGGFSENTYSSLQNIGSNMVYGAFTSKENSTRSGVLNVQNAPETLSKGSFYFDASRSSSVYKDNLTEARPVNYAINYFIKY